MRIRIQIRRQNGFRDLDMEDHPTPLLSSLQNSPLHRDTDADGIYLTKTKTINQSVSQYIELSTHKIANKLSRFKIGSM